MLYIPDKLRFIRTRVWELYTTLPNYAQLKLNTFQLIR